MCLSTNVHIKTSHDIVHLLCWVCHIGCSVVSNFCLQGAVCWADWLLAVPGCRQEHNGACLRHCHEEDGRKYVWQTSSTPLYLLVFLSVPHVLSPPKAYSIPWSPLPFSLCLPFSLSISSTTLLSLHCLFSPSFLSFPLSLPLSFLLSLPPSLFLSLLFIVTSSHPSLSPSSPPFLSLHHMCWYTRHVQEEHSSLLLMSLCHTTDTGKTQSISQSINQSINLFQNTQHWKTNNTNQENNNTFWSHIVCKRSNDWYFCCRWYTWGLFC